MVHVRSPGEAYSVSLNGTLVLHDDLTTAGANPVQKGRYRFVADGSNRRPTLFSAYTSFEAGLELATARWVGSHATSGTFVLPPAFNFHGTDLIIESATLESSGSASFTSSILVLNNTAVNLPWSASNSSITMITQSGLSTVGYTSVTSGSVLSIKDVVSFPLNLAIVDASSAVKAERSALSVQVHNEPTPNSLSTPDPGFSSALFNLTTISLLRSSLYISNVVLQTMPDPAFPTNWTLDQASQVTLSRLVPPSTADLFFLDVTILDSNSSLTYDHMALEYSSTRFDDFTGPVGASDSVLSLMRRYAYSDISFVQSSLNVLSHATFIESNITIALDDSQPLEIWWSLGAGNSLSVDHSVVTWHPITPNATWYLPDWNLTNNATVIVKEPSNPNSLLQLSSISDLDVEFPDSYFATGSLTSDVTISGTVTLTQGAITVSSVLTGNGLLSVISAESFNISSTQVVQPALSIESVKTASIGGSFTTLTLNRSAIISTSSILGDTLKIDCANYSSVSPTTSTTFNAATVSGNVSIMSGVLKLQSFSLASKTRLHMHITSWTTPTSIEVREPLSFNVPTSKRASSNSSATIRIIVSLNLPLNVHYSTRFLRTFTSAEMNVQNGPISYELYGLTAASKLVKLGSCFSVTYNASGQGYYLNSNPSTTGCVVSTPSSPSSPSSPSFTSPGNSTPSGAVVPSGGGGGNPILGPTGKMNMTGLIVGIVVGILILAVFILIFTLILFPVLKEKWQYRHNSEDDHSEDDYDSRGDTLDDPETPRGKPSADADI